MAEAAREAYEGMDKDMARLRELKELLYSELCARVDGVHANVSSLNGSPNILSVTVDGVDAICLVDSLGEKGVCVSAGSACNSRELHASHVLRAMGVSDRDAGATIRLSLSKYNNKEEIITAAEIFEETVRGLRDIYCS